MTLIQRLKLIRRRFSPLEEQLLAAVRRVLPEGARSAFDAQVAGITLVQRHPYWTMICFYRKRLGKVDWGGISLFPCRDEFRLAQVRFKAGDKGYRATLTCIGGHIFDFAITPSPKAVVFAYWKGPPEAVLLDDLLRAPTGGRRPECFPAVWLQFVELHRKQSVGDWKLYDENTAYRIPLEDGEYLVLAEREGDEFILCWPEKKKRL